VLHPIAGVYVIDATSRVPNTLSIWGNIFISQGNDLVTLHDRATGAYNPRRCGMQCPRPGTAILSTSLKIVPRFTSRCFLPKTSLPTYPDHPHSRNHAYRAAVLGLRFAMAPKQSTLGYVKSSQSTLGCALAFSDDRGTRETLLTPLSASSSATQTVQSLHRNSRSSLSRPKPKRRTPQMRQRRRTLMWAT